MLGKLKKQIITLIIESVLENNEPCQFVGRNRRFDIVLSREVLVGCAEPYVRLKIVDRDGDSESIDERAQPRDRSMKRLAKRLDKCAFKTDLERILCQYDGMRFRQYELENQ